MEGDAAFVGKLPRDGPKATHAFNGQEQLVAGIRKVISAEPRTRLRDVDQSDRMCLLQRRYDS